MKKSKLLASLSSIGVIGVVATTIATSCSNKEEKVEHTSVYWKTPKIADTVYTVDASKLSHSLWVTLESLQGILAQKEAKIFIYSDNKLRNDWFDDMKKTCNFNVVNITDPWELLKMFKDEFDSKYIFYTKTGEDEKDTSINVACALSALNKNIIVSDEIEAEAISHGYTRLLDATTMSTADIFNKYKDQLNNTMFINQKPSNINLRDYAIASKTLIGCLETVDEALKQPIVDWLKKDSVVLGWNDGTGGEMKFVKWLTENQLELLPSDNCVDLSFYSAYNPNKLYKQKRKSKEITPQKNKHYLAMVMSDGDNLHWLQGDFKSESWFGSPYRGQFPVNWTISPSTYDLNASVLDYLYGQMSDNDYFVTAPSGFAYRNIGDCISNKSFAQTTVKYMHDLDQHVINFLDWAVCNKPDHFLEFMKSDVIKGAVWSENRLHLSGAGEVVWKYDKPIVAIRDALYERQEGDLRIGPTAARINAYPCDPSKIDGYTIIMCGCWVEGKMDKLRQFVDLLDDHVELVTVDQIIDMVAKNVEHVDAVPKDHSPVPYPKGK